MTRCQLGVGMISDTYWQMPSLMTVTLSIHNIQQCYERLWSVKMGLLIY